MTAPLALGQDRKWAVEVTPYTATLTGQPMIEFKITEWGEDRDESSIDRNQAERLRDWLNEWLTEHPA